VDHRRLAVGLVACIAGFSVINSPASVGADTNAKEKPAPPIGGRAVSAAPKAPFPLQDEFTGPQQFSCRNPEPGRIAEFAGTRSRLMTNANGRNLRSIVPSERVAA